MANNSFTICSLIYSILLTIVFFSKKRINTYETKAYSNLVITNLVITVLATSTYYVIKYASELKYIYFLIPKMLLVAYILYLILFSLYVFNISMSNKKYFKISEIIFAVYDLIAIILIMILPLEYKVDGKIVYSYGLSANVVYVSTGLFILFWISCMCLNIKNIKSKKYLPVFAYIVLMGVIVVLQKINPALLLSTAVGTFVTFLMYFTIENPDIKLINELNIEKDRADRANEAKTEFLSSMSHEIRTPLNAIVGFAEIIKDKEEKETEEVSGILSASNTLIEIVNDILDISKIEANKLEIINDEYEIRNVINDISNMGKLRIENKNKKINLNVNIEENIPNVLYGDKLRIKQIMLNLVTNAIKYTNEGEINFNVFGEKVDDNIKLKIEVIDTGIGISKEKLGKLFEKFERLDVDKNSNIEGTGLGLALTKKIVELMNGRIYVKSDLGKGSTFTVELEQKIIQNKDHIEEENINYGEIKFNQEKILVVDDNDINLKVVSMLLNKYNLSIETSISGFDALEKIKSGNKYNLIFLDDMMPEMSGTETLKKLKEVDEFNTKVIALTANALVGMKEKYIESGFDDYIAKPINRKELEKKLIKYLKEEK